MTDRPDLPVQLGSTELTPLLELALERLEDALIVTEGDDCSPRRIVYVNGAFTRMTGFTRHEAIGKTPDITVGPGTDRAALARLAAGRSAQRPVREELLKYRKDGSTFWVELDIVPVLGEGGRVANYLAVLRDITERRALQARVLEADRLASLATLVAGIAHEINNPLAYILANLRFVGELLGAPQGEGGLTLPAADVKEVRAALEEVELGAERVQRIVKDLRVFARTERAKADPVDLAGVIGAALKLVQAEIGERAFVEQDVAGAGKVLGDASRLGQVFVNLLLNAAQAMPGAGATPGRIDVRARRVGDLVKVTVTDNGAGIAPEDLGRVFQPFFTTKPVGVGTGLGLPICQSILTSVAGRISVESTVGVGTTVTVTLVAESAAPVSSPVSPPVNRP